MAKKTEVIGSMGREHTTVCASWIPIGADEIEMLDNGRRFAKQPASWIDAKAYAWLKACRGAPLTPRQLSDWAGWSRRQAKYLLETVENQLSDWAQKFPSDPKADPYMKSSRSPIGPPETNDTNNIQGDMITIRSPSDHHLITNWADRARVFTSTDTNTSTDKGENPPPTEQQPKKRKPRPPKAEVLALWDELVAMRHRHREGARATRTLDPSMARALDKALTWATHAQVVHAYDWWLRSEACEWWRSRRVDIDTFIRPSKLGGFVRDSEEWSYSDEQATALRRIQCESKIPF